MTQDLTQELTLLKKKLARETDARKQAENLLETKAFELYEVNETLTNSIRKAKNNSSRLNAIMNSIPDGIITTDKDLNMLDINNAAEKFLKNSRIRLMKNSLLPYVCPDQTNAYQDLCNKAINDGISGIEEFDFKITEDEIIATEVKISVFEHDDEYFLLHLIHDITRKKERAQEHKQLQEELAQSAKWEAVGQLAGGIAHEINTPSQYIGDNLHFLNESLAQIFTLLQNALILKKQSAADGKYADLNQKLDQLIKEYDLAYLIEEVPEAVKQSSNGIKQISRIVGAMKNFSHPGAKDKEPFNINSSLETTLTVSRNEWKNVAEIEKNFDENLIPVNCIPGAINQVFLNLIVNATHAIAEKSSEMGKITITTRNSADGIDIYFKDTGCGIAPEHQKDIFNPFFTTKEVGKGSGQGLSIVRDIIVNKHKGTIDFQTTPGQGTSFHIHLPEHPKESSPPC
ncbi:ATP-binding protein [Terasakiella pusilla]|uniref:ATP-binding protein n=1 Tax=Terasakiella pusilla TaxID=64973 RepID=UPI003AA7B366